MKKDESRIEPVRDRNWGERRFQLLLDHVTLFLDLRLRGTNGRMHDNSLNSAGSNTSHHCDLYPWTSTLIPPFQ